MPMKAKSPFTDADLVKINAGITALQSTKQLLDDCKECGLDVGAYSDDCDHCLGMLQAIKDKFFTIRPTGE